MSGRIDGLLLEQDGIIARWQVLAAGHDDNWIENRLRRREWARVHRGVYVAHTGPVTWRQQAWAALLCTGPRHCVVDPRCTRRPVVRRPATGRWPRCP
jgi:hypothetical protein